MVILYHSVAFTYGQIISDGSSMDTLTSLAKLQPHINADDTCNIQFTSVSYNALVARLKFLIPVDLKFRARRGILKE